ncbi:MAG: TIGR03016 family PEP-CTERM system-associated outer membrane protein [Burkholderiales bacterium]
MPVPEGQARPGRAAAGRGARRASLVIGLALSGAVQAQLGGLPGVPGAALPGTSTGLAVPALGAPSGERTLSFLPGVRSTVLAADSPGAGAGPGSGRQTLEVTPYLSAGIADARTQASLSYQMRNFAAHGGAGSDLYTRHDLRASGNTLLAGDWLGLQAGAAVYNTNASLAGGLSVDPAASALNNAVLRTLYLAPYLRGRFGAQADWRVQYRGELTDTSGNVNAALARSAHYLNAQVTSGAAFNPWGWALVSGGQRRDFTGGLSLSSATTSATLYYTPSAELRLGASMNYLYIERLSNSDGDTHGWGPGVSLDWSPSRRTTLRGSFTRQYYGNNGTLSLSHRTQRLVFGLDYANSLLQTNTASLLTFNPGAIFAAGGFSPALNPLFNQLAGLGLLSNTDLVVGTPVINDAMVRNHSLSASVGWVSPVWSGTATAFRSTRETLLASTVFGIPNGLSPASFGLFNNRGIALNGSLTLDARHALLLAASVRDSTQSNSDLRVRFSVYQAAISSRIDERSTATVGVRRTVQSAEGSGGVSGEENALFGTIDFRMR